MSQDSQLSWPSPCSKLLWPFGCFSNFESWVIPSLWVIMWVNLRWLLIYGHNSYLLEICRMVSYGYLCAVFGIWGVALPSTSLHGHLWGFIEPIFCLIFSTIFLFRLSEYLIRYCNLLLIFLGSQLLKSLLLSSIIMDFMPSCHPCFAPDLGFHIKIWCAHCFVFYLTLFSRIFISFHHFRIYYTQFQFITFSNRGKKNSKLKGCLCLCHLKVEA